MEIIGYVLIFALGAGAGVWGRRRLGPSTAQVDAAAADEPESAAALSESGGRDTRAGDDLYNLAAYLNDFYERSAHPRDLLSQPEFTQGVALLTGDEYTESELLDYVTSGNTSMACMAGEALAQRAAPAEVAERLLEVTEQLHAWPLFFVLRCLRRLEGPAYAGRLLARAEDWWANSSFVVRAIDEYLACFSAQELVEAVQAQASELKAESLAVMEGLASKLHKTTTAPLLAWLAQRRRAQVDLEVLQTIGRVVTDDEHPTVPHAVFDAQLQQLGDSLSAGQGRSVLVVGEAGVGKSALIHAVGRRLADQGWTLFMATAADVLAGQTYIGELENRIRSLVANLGAVKQVLWYVPNFYELLHAGTHRFSPVGILDLLLPYVENGQISLIGELQPGAYERLIQARRRVQSAFDVLRVRALSEPAALDLAARWAASDDGSQERPLLGAGLLREALQLVKHHFPEKSAPGNLLEFLKFTSGRLAREGRAGQALQMEDLLTSLALQTGLPRSLLDHQTGLDTDDLQRHFQQRVIGQAEAVACLVERVAMIKAGLTDPTRPLGVFLFAGPTGTGKTEIAKALAEFLFGSAQRMIRLDMSEFQTAESVSRLLAERGDDTDSQALVHLIRKQPFSVVLLDEVEKAHPRIWDLFLQVFDDGRLTDRQGRLADFRHSIIILTSNLGATISSGLGIGFTAQRGAFSPSAVHKSIATTFRREFINRLDRVVVFHPLSRAVMRQILHKELEDALQRRGLRNRQWAVEWDESAVEFLLGKGFTMDMGARPLKRAIEQYLLAPLAMTIVANQFPAGDQFLFVRSDGVQLQVEFIDPDQDDTPKEPEHAERPEGALHAEVDNLRLPAVALDPSGTQSELAFLEVNLEHLQTLVQADAWLHAKQAALQRTGAAEFWDSPERFATLGRIELMDRIESGLGSAASLLQRLAGAHNRHRTQYAPDLIARLAQQLYLLEQAYHDLDTQQPTDAFLSLELQEGTHKDATQAVAFYDELHGMYQAWATKRRMRIQLLLDKRDPQGDCQVIYAVSGFGAYSILKSEAGLHLFEVPHSGSSFLRCKVRVLVVPQPDQPSRGRRSQLEQAQAALSRFSKHMPEVVRRYRKQPSPLVRDGVRNWRTGRLDRVLQGDFDLIT